jgi:hypothetical protein
VARQLASVAAAAGRSLVNPAGHASNADTSMMQVIQLANQYGRRMSLVYGWLQQQPISTSCLLLGCATHPLQRLLQEELAAGFPTYAAASATFAGSANSMRH